MHDQLATGRRLRILTIIDVFSRHAPVIDPRFSHRGEDVVQMLDRVCARVGYPKTIRVDQGSEFVSHELKTPAGREPESGSGAPGERLCHFLEGR